MKLTYAEQLRHPMWQRRRLEMLSAADWKCSACAEASAQLHVHHKQYFKGRMAWDYSNDELQVLCETCHEKSHVVDARIKAVLARVSPDEALALLIGFFGDEGDDATALNLYPDYARVIEVAQLANCLLPQTTLFLSDIWAKVVDADMERGNER